RAAVRTTTAAGGGSLHVADGPSTLVAAGALLVGTKERGTSVAVVAADDMVTDVAVPCGGTRGAAFDGEHTVYVACPNDERVVAVDVVAHAVTKTLDVPGKPTAVAIARGTLYVTASRLGHVAALRLDALDAAPELTT